MKIKISFLLIILTIVISSFTAFADTFETYMIPGYYEIWFDGGENQFKAQLANDVVMDLGLPGPSGSFGPQITHEFPAATILSVDSSYNYEVVAIEPCLENDDFIYESERANDVPEDKVFRNYMKGFTIANADSYIGNTETYINFTLNFQTPAISEFDFLNTKNVFRIYTPIKVTFKKTPSNAELHVTGDASPNPVVLTNGSGTHYLDIDTFVTGLEGDTPKDWTIEYRSENDMDWTYYSTSDSSDSVSKSYNNLTITEDTTYYLRASMTTVNGMSLNAEGETTVLVSTGNSGNIVPDLRLDVLTDAIDVTQSDIDNKKRFKFEVEFDAEASMVEVGSPQALFYYEPGDMGFTHETDFHSDLLRVLEIEVDCSEMDGLGRVELDGRVWIRDGNGDMKPASDDVYLQFNLIVRPGTIDLEGSETYMPKIVTDQTGTDVNKVDFNYNHPDNISSDYFEVKIYDADSGALLVDTTTTNQYWDIEGEPGVYELKVIGYDTNGTPTNEDTLLVFIGDGLPTCEVVITKDELNNRLLHIETTDTTPLEVIDIFPNSWDGYVIYDKNDTVLASGSGKLPDSLNMTDDMYGTILYAKQFIKNSIGQGEGFDDHVEGSLLDFEITPNSLYETQLAETIDYSVGITNKSWGIASEWTFAFEPLVLDLENKFTKEPGAYDVRLSGDAYSGQEHYITVYSNTYSDLVSVPTVTAQYIIDNHGVDNTLVSNSVRWTTSISVGNFSDAGDSYKYKRTYKYIIEGSMYRYMILPVTFKDATPTAAFTIDGELKMYREVLLDGSDSITATDSDLQAVFPIQFNDARTKFTVTPILDASGTEDSNRVDDVKGENGILQGNTIEFQGVRTKDIGYDADALYRVSYQVWNGVKLSEVATEDMMIQYDFAPTTNIAVEGTLTHQDINNQLIVTMPLVMATYGSQDDVIDLDKSYLAISHDANNNGDFTDDGESSTMRVYRDPSKSILQDYVNVIWQTMNEDHAVYSFVVDNPEKTIYGKFKFDMYVYELPVTNYYDIDGVIPDMYGSTHHVADADKIIMVDSQAPSLDLATRKKATIEVFTINTTDKPLNRQFIADQLRLQGVRVILEFSNLDGTTEIFKTFDE